MKLGVVGDDLTGSNDIGIMFAKAGFPTEIFTFEPGSPVVAQQVAASKAAVVILNTSARLLEPAEAYRLTFQATQLLQQSGCRQFYSKTCSVFRGPVGAYFDGMLDALGQDFALVVLGFPKNGRTTRGGIHYVHGKRLEELEFRNDPIHPMRRSDLVEILQSQTRRKVRLLETADLAVALQTAPQACNYLVLDVPDQAALQAIAAAAHQAPVFCGSSGLAEELARVWEPWPANVGDQPPLPPAQRQGILVAAGSLMPQTRAQLDWLSSSGLPVLKFDPAAIFEAGLRSQAVEQIRAKLVGLLAAGRDAAFHMPNSAPEVAEIQQRGQDLGLPRSAVGELVSATLAEIVSRVVADADLNRLVIAGGETSAAVCARLGISGFRLWQEIEPGLPSCLALGTRPMALVLKSGSFGSPPFLAKALAHLHQVTGGLGQVSAANF